MGRDFYINGEALVTVKGSSGSGIASLQQLGLAEGPIRVTANFKHKDIIVDAWGPEVGPEIQCFLQDAIITMTLVHFDPDILDICLRESQGGSTGPGTTARAGARMGNNQARFGALNHFIGLNITSTVAGRPWRFLTAYMTGPPFEFPLGTEKSLVVTNWRAIPYAVDPWNNGSGALGTVVWDHTSDT